MSTCAMIFRLVPSIVNDIKLKQNTLTLSLRYSTRRGSDFYFSLFWFCHVRGENSQKCDNAINMTCWYQRVLISVHSGWYLPLRFSLEVIYVYWKMFWLITCRPQLSTDSLHVFFFVLTGVSLNKRKWNSSISPYTLSELMIKWDPGSIWKAIWIICQS